MRDTILNVIVPREINFETFYLFEEGKEKRKEKTEKKPLIYVLFNKS
jgi:hypothetical protein